MSRKFSSTPNSIDSLNTSLNSQIVQKDSIVDSSRAFQFRESCVHKLSPSGFNAATSSFTSTANVNNSNSGSSSSQVGDSGSTILPKFEIEIIRPLPTEVTIPTNVLIFRDAEAVAFNEWILEKCESNVIRPVPDGFLQCYSNHFVLLAHEKKPKIIGNFKPLNAVCKRHHFKGPSAQRIIRWAASKLFKTKVDLRNGYYNSQVDDDSQKFLGFRWRDQDYCYLRTPLGPHNAPRFFKQFISAFLNVFVLKDVHQHIEVYYDDFVIANDDFDIVVSTTNLLLQGLEAAGFWINWDKSITTPLNSIEILGFTIDKDTVFLPESKKSKIFKSFFNSINNGSGSKRHRQKLLGLLDSTLVVHDLDLHREREVLRSYIKMIPEEDADIDFSFNEDEIAAFSRILSLFAPVNVSEALLEIDNFDSVFSDFNAHIVLYSDASNSHFGSYYLDVDGRKSSSSYVIPDTLLNKHIIVKEAFAILHALMEVSQVVELSLVNIIVCSDNLPFLQVITKNGDSTNMDLQFGAHRILKFLLDSKANVRFAHVNGFQNLADVPSRPTEDAPVSSPDVEVVRLFTSN